MNRQELEKKHPQLLHDLALWMQHAAKSVAGDKILVSVGMAQFLDESGALDGPIRAPGNNAMGIKAGSSWRGPVVDFKTHEVIHGQREAEEDEFRAYPSLAACCEDYAHILTTRKVYAPAIELVTPEVRILRPVVYHGPVYEGQEMPLWEAYLRRIALVYATNPQYGADLIQIVRDLELLGFELPGRLT